MVLEVDGGVARVTLNRAAALNAQTPQTWLALAWIGENLDETVRVVIVKGVGRTFSAGLDRKSMPELMAAMATSGPAATADLVANFQKGFSWLADPRFISIAAVKGHALGAGFQLALACDLIIAAEDAQFSMFEINLGLVPDLTGTKRLAQAIGHRRALELCATGRTVRATEAWEIGLINKVVPVTALSEAVNDLAQELLAKSATALRAVSRLLASAATNDPATQQLAERTEQAALIGAFPRQ